MLNLIAIMVLSTIQYNAFQELKHYENSIVFYNKAIQRCSNYAYAYSGKGKTHFNNNRLSTCRALTV